MNSRERVNRSLNHLETDKIPVDFGATPVSGISASVLHKLRKFYNLKNETPLKIIEPYQMLGEISEDLRNILRIDVIGLSGKNNIFGFENKNWKKWELFDGTQVLVPAKFNTESSADGYIYQYPQGDKNSRASARMPFGGYYFDTIIRQVKIEENKLKIDDNLEEFGIYSDDELKYIEKESEYLYQNTDYAIVGNFGGMSFGDIALVPGPSLKDPKGIRDIEEWYISLIKRKDFIYELFSRQSEIALKNLEKIFHAVADRIDVIIISATDFGTQRAPFLPVEIYKELFQPFHTKLNNWVHKNTKWKTFMHSCGSIETLIPEFINSGFDILNPVQISAENMDAKMLKNKYGKKIVFWGGGIDTQKTLPFKSAEEVKAEVNYNLKIFSQDGGFIFNTIHNIQAKTPIENVIAMIEAVHSY